MTENEAGKEHACQLGSPKWQLVCRVAAEKNVLGSCRKLWVRFFRLRPGKVLPSPHLAWHGFRPHSSRARHQRSKPRLQALAVSHWPIALGMMAGLEGEHRGVRMT